MNDCFKPSRWMDFLLHRMSGLFSDEKYLKIYFRHRMNKTLDLDNPKSYSEKLQWLKLYYHNPPYTKLVDKYEVKDYVANIIGEDHIIKTIGVWNEVEDIDFDKLPEKFVLKTTHNSGGVVICKNRKDFDKNKALATISKSLKTNHYLATREWPYKNVQPRIIAEEYMEDESGELRDYKFFCFDGEVKAMFLATDRYSAGEETKFDFFDRDFNHLPFKNGHPNSTKSISKPEKYEEMLSIAEKLSEGMPHVRVDLYNINGHIYFGELTFFHWGGVKPFEPEEWDYKFGEWLKLPEKKL